MSNVNAGTLKGEIEDLKKRIAELEIIVQQCVRVSELQKVLGN